MKRFLRAFLSLGSIGLLAISFVLPASAQTRNQREVRDLVRTLAAQADDFKYGLEYEMNNNAAGSNANAGRVSRALSTLQDRVSAFDDNFVAKRENRNDVNDIVAAVNDVDAAVSGISLNRRLQGDWADLKKTVTSLGANYGVVPRFGSRASGSQMPNDSDDDYVSPQPVTRGGLTGTYSIDTVRSENVATILSSTGVAASNRTDLESKLEAPEQIALDVRGDQVTLASSKATPVTITADGAEKVESAGGRTVRLRATLRGDELTVSSLGGETDYTIIFTSTDGGRGLKVTRRITTDYLSETVFAESVYTKTDEVAGLGIVANDTIASGDYSSNDSADTSSSSSSPNFPNPIITPGRTGEFIVPNGAIIVASLENMIDSKVSQNNDRFKLTVQSPSEFRGAVIEGYLSGIGRSGRISGSSNVSFNFTSITLRDGKRYDFAGSLQGIKDQYGKTVKVDSEGTAKSDSQTKETVKRGGIGAGIGALIGAIAGGGKGAAIGAIIGGGAGAGSVYATGREDIKLQQGSTMTIQSSSPIRAGAPVSEN